jgi:hypothetical protein
MFTEAPLSKAKNNNEAIPNLTYFVHKGDSVYQLFNVSIEAEGSKKETTVVGYLADTDARKYSVYEHMAQHPNEKFNNPEDKDIANQVHLFAQDFTFDEGTDKIRVTQDQTKRCELYKVGKNGAPKLIKGVCVTAGLVGGVLVFSGLRKSYAFAGGYLAVLVFRGAFW